MKAIFSHMSNIVLLKKLGLKHTALQRRHVVQFQYCTTAGIRYIRIYFALYNMHVLYKCARKNVLNICTTVYMMCNSMSLSKKTNYFRNVQIRVLPMAG